MYINPTMKIGFTKYKTVSLNKFSGGNILYTIDPHILKKKYWATNTNILNPSISSKNVATLPVESFEPKYIIKNVPDNSNSGNSISSLITNVIKPINNNNEQHIVIDLYL